MPYIYQLRREYLDVYPIDAETPGELNYVITKLLIDYVGGEVSYQSINDVVGALEGAKLEFYRRVASPYEDKKILENGDVY